MFRAFYVSVTIICATYYVQLELAYLVIEREMIKKRVGKRAGDLSEPS